MATGASKKEQSLTIASVDTFATCPCDLTAKACDNNCCCDPDCPKSIKDIWLENPTENCKEYYKDHRAIPFRECTTSINQRKISDLQNGMLYFGKVGNMLMCAAKTGYINNTQSFIGPIKNSPPKTFAEYKTIYDSNIKDFEVLHYETDNRQSSLNKYT